MNAAAAGAAAYRARLEEHGVDMFESILQLGMEGKPLPLDPHEAAEVIAWDWPTVWPWEELALAKGMGVPDEEAFKEVVRLWALDAINEGYIDPEYLNDEYDVGKGFGDDDDDDDDEVEPSKAA